MCPAVIWLSTRAVLVQITFSTPYLAWSHFLLIVDLVRTTNSMSFN